LKKEIEIGRVEGNSYGYKQSLPVTIEIELKQENKGVVLSIVGNIWQPRRGDIVEGGQCQDTIREHLNDGTLKLKGYTKEEILKLLDIWDRWHLNDLRAGCEHQRALIPLYKKEKGEDFFNASNYDEIIKLPEFKKCPVCGYKYGTAWLFEPLPKEVISFIRELV